MSGFATWEETEATLARNREVKAVLDLMAQDIASTLGWTIAEADDFVIGTAAILLDFIDDGEWPFELRVMESVQQRMHDEFIDTSWPECPAHGKHPLWLSDEAPWSWNCQGVSIPVGRLSRR